jgi:hypothetical protein
VGGGAAAEQYVAQMANRRFIGVRARFVIISARESSSLSRTRTPANNRIYGDELIRKLVLW